MSRGRSCDQMNALPFDSRPRAAEAVRLIVAEHGFRPVLLAVLGAGLGRRSAPAPRPAAALSAHLRRDVGLPPEARELGALNDHLRRDIGLLPLGGSQRWW